MRALSLVFICALAGCTDDSASAPDSTSAPASASAETGTATDEPNGSRGDDHHHHHGRDVLYDRDDHPFGRSVERWSELLWSYIYAQPFDDNPFFSTTGENCGIGQDGPVWFLPAVPGASLGNVVTRSCTIPRHKAIMLQLASLVNDFPCPDPTFAPAPGQSLYDFLIDPITPGVDAVTEFHIFLDGAPVEGFFDNRYTSDNVFVFRPDLSMQAWDSCVSDHPELGVSDGYYLMFKPLAPGHHTIVVNGQDMEGTAITLTENLTIR